MENGKELKIILIEDDEDDYIIVKELLRQVLRVKFHLEWVKVYEDGIKGIASEKYDVALVDYRLGKDNGIELIESANKAGTKTPIILLTGQGDIETDIRAMKAGAVDYLVKGNFEAQTLERTIRYAIERKRSENKIKELNEELEERVDIRTKQLKEANEELKKEVQERKRAEEESEREKEVIEGIMNSTVEAIYGIDMEGRCTFLNTAAEKLFGFSEKELLGKRMHLTVHYQRPDGSIYPEEECPLNISYRQGKVLSQLEETFFKKDGTSFPALCSVSPLYSSESVVGAVVSLIDITERKQTEEKIYHLAYHDPLTKLPNRILLKDRLSQALVEAKRHNHYVGVMFLDLDRFKNINDSLGHKAGDTLLKSVAKRLKECVREEDTVARQGGDEFILVLPRLDNAGNIDVVAQKIIEALSRPFQLGSDEIVITPSIGISVYPNDADTSDTLIKYADVAMYFSKKIGRNTYRYFAPEMNAEAIQKLNTEIGLRKAFGSDQLKFYYQPKYSLFTNKIVSAEALIRWQHPVLGLVPPDKFIPTAEESGLIDKLGEWELNAACSQIREWKEKGLEPLRIAVNISPKLLKWELISTITEYMDRHNVEPKHLEIEITESDIMQYDTSITPILKELKALGIKIAIDDFGTGYSSLSRLQELPVDSLKIDKAFINAIPSNQDGVSIVKAIIAVAKSLKLKVIAEGVETASQIKMLRRNKCDEIQGYYISKAVPPEEFEQFLSKSIDEREGSFLKNKLKFFKP